MVKRLSLLNGLAIIAVVSNHATQMGYTALFLWTYRYRPVTVPNYDALYSPTYDILTTIEKLAVFSVPTFLFFSGFFVAFAARGMQSSLTWKTVRTRVVNLLIPYFIWSIVVFTINYLQGERLAWYQFVLRLLYGGAIPHYFFVPLLCQLYVLSPFMVNLAKKKGWLLLLITGIIQALMMLITYLGLFIHTEILNDVLGIMKYWSLFPMWIFFFALGIYTSFNIDRIKNLIYCYKWWLLGSTATFAALAVGESDWIFSQTGNNWRDTALTLPSTIYALSFILTFLAFEEVAIPFSKFFAQLGARTYGIYLIHTKVVGFAAALMLIFTPLLLPYQVIMFPFLVIVGLGIPYLFMSLVAKSPARKVYKYLFS